MILDDIKISRAIVDTYFKKLMDTLELDVALVGAGPSNLVAGKILADNGIKAAIFESKLSPGGGMWGGGMMFNELVVQESALDIFKAMGVSYKEFEDGYYTADSIEATATFISSCIKAGTKIFELVKVEDVMFCEKDNQKRINGLVLNWSPVDSLGLHVDPLTIRAKYVVDGTGHEANICTIVSRKMDAKLNTPTGKVVGEMSMSANTGELKTIENAREVYPGLYVTGMAANAVMGAPRMGPVFGGMMLSGKKIAEEIIYKIKNER